MTPRVTEPPFWQFASKEAVVRFTRQLAVMTEAGVSVTRCLEILCSQEEDPVLRYTLPQLLQHVMEGRYLSDAMEGHPKAFSVLTVNMLRLGESIGSLTGTAHRLSDLLERNLQAERKLRAALVYPLLVTACSVVMVGAMFEWVVPPLLDACTGLSDGAALPWPTVVLQHLVAVFTNPYVMVPLLAALMVAMQRFDTWRQSPLGRLRLGQIMLTLPGFGPLHHKLIVSQFCRSLSIMMASGLPIMQSLRVLERLVTNRWFSDKVVHVILEQLQTGVALSELLGTHRFPPAMVQMVLVGESSGTLPEMLDMVARLYDDDLNSVLEALLAAIEPVLIGLMGLIVGFILIAVFLPLYSAMGRLH